MSQDRCILVTDSGMGGISVFNRIACRLETQSPWEQVRLIYFNAWPAPKRGYNHFPTPEQRAAVFHNALEAMAACEPDTILIACNTLSVIYPATRFSSKTRIPVQGIVDHGVAMLYEQLAKEPDSTAVILGTPTTAEARSHEKGLIARGIDPDRIITVACTDLAGKIEREPFAPVVKEMIDTYAGQAADRLKGKGKVFSALCCTHFGYKADLFQAAFDTRLPGRTELINPNDAMADALFEDMPAGSPARLTTKVLSQAVWSKDQIRDCIKMLDPVSEAVRSALKDYEHQPNLFATD